MDGRAPAKREQLFYLYGAAKSGMLYDLAAFEKLGARTFTCTVDGSHGLRGNVVRSVGAWDMPVNPTGYAVYQMGIKAQAAQRALRRVTAPGACRAARKSMPPRSSRRPPPE